MHHLDHWRDKLKHVSHPDHEQRPEPRVDPISRLKTNDQPPPPGSSGPVAAITQRAIDVFLLSKQENGEIGGIGYWQTANGYTAMALHDKWCNSTHNARMLQDLLQKVERHHPNFVNEFNDDTLWWGICLLELSDLTCDPIYIQKAIIIWHHVSRSVISKGQHSVRGKDMEGGVLWTTKPGEDSINTITTGQYAELSARLAMLCSMTDGVLDPTIQLPSTDDFVQAAERSVEWIIRCRYREHDAIVLDTIHLKSGERVDWTFTYTTGQLIAASAALFAATRSPSHLKLAIHLAERSMVRHGWVDSNGILTEAGAYGRENHQAWQNDDAVGFKSVLIRSLAKLYAVLVEQNQNQHREVTDTIGRFVRRNFRSLQEHNTNGNGQYGPWWAGPMDMPTSHAQLAVLDVMAAVGLVDRG
ncbi:hypothetical protein H2203_003102 [Taxawa tesnikishii (nom. ined.)]|nr:hypothetical protein H2203_003102 [Dothideales sp. JES 119]